LTEAPRSKYFGHHRVLLYGDVGNSVKRGIASCAHAGNPESGRQQPAAFVNQSRWYYHSNSLVNCIDDTTREWFREFLVHGSVWTGACDNAVHRSQRLTVKPLKRDSWPRDPLGPSWPSFPSIPEWMEMLRKGIDPFERPELKIPVGNTGYTRVPRGELHSNYALATRIVANVIVGIRSSVEVPAKFRGYFRYRQNFLILTARAALPIGLVRFLLGRWCRAPYSLWLRRQCTLKQYLRKVPISLVKQARLWLAESTQGVDPTRAGSCTPSDEFSDMESMSGSSMLD
jgi:hypothetical protein